MSEGRSEKHILENPEQVSMGNLVGAGNLVDRESGGGPVEAGDLAGVVF